MIVKKAGNGNYYLCRISTSSHTGKKFRKTYNNTWLVKENSGVGRITLYQNKHTYHLAIPKELIGKRVIIIVEPVKGGRVK